MKRFIKLMLSISVITGGLATYGGREFPSWRAHCAPVYPATVLSVYMAFTGGGMMQTGDCSNAPLWSRVVGWAIVAPCALTAVPVAFVIDTVLLPVDLYRKRERNANDHAAMGPPGSDHKFV